MSGPLIGLVEDEPVIRANYADLLKAEGYRVESYADRKQAIDGLEAHRPDLALIDVALGVERDGGYQLCSDLRNLYPSLPILFLTSHDSEIDRISGLRVGADDYVSKDTSMDYLLVRIETLLRRIDDLTGRHPEEETNIRSIGRLTINTKHSTVFWREKPIDLALTQAWIVTELATSSVVRRPEELMRAARIVVEPNTIAAHIKNIRRKFLSVDPDFSQIKTERGLGYRWLPEA